MHSPHAEKIFKKKKIENGWGGPLLQTAGFCSLSSILPRPQRTWQPESLGNMEISEILKKKRKEKDQAAVERTRYIGLNIYTETEYNCSAGARGKAEAECGGRPGRPARVYCLKRGEAATGNQSGAGPGQERGGSCRGGPSSPRRSGPGGGKAC